MDEESNMFVLVFIAIFAIIIIFATTYANKDMFRDTLYCEADSDCVQDSCCHATACISIENKPDCVGVACTQICEPGTLDCGYGSCKCVNNQCAAVFAE